MWSHIISESLSEWELKEGQDRIYSWHSARLRVWCHLSGWRSGTFRAGGCRFDPTCCMISNGHSLRCHPSTAASKFTCFATNVKQIVADTFTPDLDMHSVHPSRPVILLLSTEEGVYAETTAIVVYRGHLVFQCQPHCQQWSIEKKKPFIAIDHQPWLLPGYASRTCSWCQWTLPA